MSKYDYYIGIDPGTKTGIAVWSTGKQNIIQLLTLPIHKAMKVVHVMHAKGSMRVRMEDARLRKWFGSNSDAKRMGAGSIKRDCSIWEDWLTDEGIEFDLLAPKNTKMNSELFKKLSGWNARCSEHARDAANLVIGIKR